MIIDHSSSIQGAKIFSFKPKKVWLKNFRDQENILTPKIVEIPHIARLLKILGPKNLWNGKDYFSSQNLLIKDILAPKDVLRTANLFQTKICGDT